MPANRPMGPRPILVGGLLVGVGLILWAWGVPTLNIIWQVPLGLLLVVSSLGKMSSR